MPLTVIISGEKEPRSLNVSRAKVKEILGILGLNSNEHVVLRNNEVLTDEDDVFDGDVLTIFTVKSGG
ncbi:MAG: MoaD/ThiS family protein [Thermosphaera sp.]